LEPKFWNNKKCEDCPKGLKRINKKCVKIIPTSCRPGTKKNAEGKCEKPVIIKVVTKCGEGEKKVGQKCIKEEAPECSKSFVYNKKSGNCEKTVIEEVACDKGYKREGDNCVKSIEVCPAGYKPDPINKKECMKYVEDKCELGYKKDSNGKCTKVIKIIVLAKCPSDFKLDAKTKKCTKKLGPGTCPEKHKWDQKLKKCTKVVIVKPAPEQPCPKGYSKNQKGDCTKIIVVTANCPKGYTLNKAGECLKTIVIIQNGKPVCPKNFKYDEKAKQCISIVTKPTVCPKGTVRDTKTNKCKKIPPKVVKPTCKPGFVLKDGKCVKVTVKVSCKPTFKINPKTKKCEKVKIIIKCSEGFKLNKAGICEKV
jgi:hypothetical protein